MLSAKFLQSCPTPCDPMHCSPPGFSVHGILQARILECPFLGDLLNPGIESMTRMSSAVAGGSLPLAPPGNPMKIKFLHLSSENAQYLSQKLHSNRSKRPNSAAKLELLGLK